MRFIKYAAVCLFSIIFFHSLSTDLTFAQSPLIWNPLNEPGTGGRMDSIRVSPHDSSHLLAGGDILGTRISTDQGSTWLATSGWLSYELADFTWHPENESLVWAGSLSGPHLSTDGGNTWAAHRAGMPSVSSGLYTAPVEKILFDPDSNKILAFGGDHRQLVGEQGVVNYGVVWVSEDNGDHWDLLSEIVSGGNIMAASYAGGAKDKVYAAIWEHGLFYSSDDGATWVPCNTGLPRNKEGNILISSLAVHPEDSKTAWITVEQYGIYKTTDSGFSWQLLDQGLPTDRTIFWSIAVASDGQTLYAGNRNYEHRPGVYKSTDGGNNWTLKFYNIDQIDVRDKAYLSGINPWWVAIDPQASNIVYTGTDTGIYRSIDGGEEWIDLTAQRYGAGWRGSGFGGLVSRNIEWNPYTPHHIILQGMDEAKVMQSWDGGCSWRVNNPDLSPFNGGHDVAFSPGWIFATFGQYGNTDELIARSNDNGLSWTLLHPPVSSAEVTQVHVDSTNPDRLWIVLDGQLWYSNNATKTVTPEWVNLEVGFRENKVGDIEAIPNNESAFYISTDDGVYHTLDGLFFRSIGGPKSAENVELATSPSAPHILYVARDKAYWDDYGVWQYNLSENKWIRIWEDRRVTSWAGDIAVHPYDANMLAIVTNDFPYHDETWATGVWLSQDGGRTWRQENQGLPMLRGDVVAFHPDGQSLVVGLGGAGFYVADLKLSQRKLSHINLSDWGNSMENFNQLGQHKSGE